MTSNSSLQSLLRRDRAIVLTGLGAVIVISWLYLLSGAGMQPGSLEMTPGGSGAGMALMHTATWTADYAVLMFFMWWIMMVAMMLPSAAPTILLHALVYRKQAERLGPHVPTGFFALGYLAAWAGFSLAAVALQWGLEKLDLLSPMMATTSAMLGGAVLAAAGLYQLTPLKHACLRHCRSPVHFLSQRWRNGRAGALAMGLEHGAYCLGCCWMLMGLLFVGGVMNLYWIVGLAAYVLIEKLTPVGHWVGSAVGVGLVLWGAGLIMVTLHAGG